MVNVIYKSQIFSQIFGNYHHKISHFDRKNHKKNCEILEGLHMERLPEEPPVKQTQTNCVVTKLSQWASQMA